MSLILALVACALLLFFFEIFLPGMVLFALGAILLLSASVITFTEYGIMEGFMVLLGSSILALGMFFLELKFISKSRFARGLFLTSENKAQSNIPAGGNELIGKAGITLTVMSPSGYILIENRKYLAHSRTGHLHSGARVKVVAQDAFKITIQPE